MKREEDLKEDELLLYAQLDTLTNNLVANTSDYSLDSDMKIVDPLNDSMPSRANGVHQVNQIDNNKIQIDAHSKTDIGYSTSHYVRYKFQDGKHIKIWECGICK